MDLDRLRGYLERKTGATVETPWGPQDLVFKAGGKVFAVLARDDEPPRLSVKCDPERVDELRAVFAAVQPPPYFNKRHWNLVVLDGSVPDAEVEAMVDESYALVVAGLTRRRREALAAVVDADR